MNINEIKETTRKMELIKAIEDMGQGVYIESILFNSNFKFTKEEIKEFGQKYPNEILIKDDKLFTDIEIIKNSR